MASRYAQADLPAAENDRRGLLPRRGALPAEVEPAPEYPQPAQTSAEGEDEDTGRFRAGALSPVDTRRRTPLPSVARQKGKERGRPLKVFDRALLVAEVASALVVSWLVFQYIYTVYFDTAPRRVTPQRAGAQVTKAPTSAPLMGAGLDATATPTRLVEAAPLSGSGALPPEAPTYTPTITPTPEPTVDPALLLPVRLRIPVMFLDSVVHEVTINMGEWEVSPMDIGHHEGTGNPGETGNVVLAGHRDINSALFRELDRLEPGDEVFVSNKLREYRYVVTESIIVTPEHIEVMDPTDDKRVTLITCTPPGLATQRLVVTAILDETSGE